MKLKGIFYKPIIHVKAASVLALMLSMCLTSACAGSGTSTVIAGSTSVQPYVEVLAEEYAVLYSDSDIDIQGGGSSAGITAAETGTADIGMSSRDLNEKEQYLWSVEIARDGLAVIVNPNNPISGLSLEQVRGIYSGSVTDWSELGGNAAKIHIIAREDGSGTRSAFESLVMEPSEISTKAIVQDSNGAVRLLVADDINAIGFISLGLVDDTVKSLSLDGVAASGENVINGTYSLFRPFLFVALGEPSGSARHFIDFALSPHGQQLFVDEGLIPII